MLPSTSSNQHKLSHGLLSPPSSGRQRDSNSERVPSRIQHQPWNIPHPDCDYDIQGTSQIVDVDSPEEEHDWLSYMPAGNGKRKGREERVFQADTVTVRSNPIHQAQNHFKPIYKKLNPFKVYKDGSKESANEVRGDSNIGKDLDNRWVKESLKTGTDRLGSAIRDVGYEPEERVGFGRGSEEKSAMSNHSSNPIQPSTSNSQPTSLVEQPEITFKSQSQPTYYSKRKPSKRKFQSSFSISAAEDEDDNPFLVKKKVSSNSTLSCSRFYADRPTSASSVKSSEGVGKEIGVGSGYHLPTVKIKGPNPEEEDGEDQDSSPSFIFEQRFRNRELELEEISIREEEESKSQSHEEHVEEFPEGEDEHEHEDQSDQEDEEFEFEDELDRDGWKKESVYWKEEPVRDSPFNPFLAGGRADFGRSRGLVPLNASRNPSSTIQRGGSGLRKGLEGGRRCKGRSDDDENDEEVDEMESSDDDIDEEREGIDIRLDEKKKARMNAFGSRNKGVTVYVFRGTQVTYLEQEPSDSEPETNPNSQSQDPDEDEVLVDSQSSNYRETYRHDKVKIEPRPSRFRPKLLFPEAHEKVRKEREERNELAYEDSNLRPRNRRRMDEAEELEKDAAESQQNRKRFGKSTRSGFGRALEVRKVNQNQHQVQLQEQGMEMGFQKDGESKSLLEALDRTGWEEDEDDG